MLVVVARTSYETLRFSETLSTTDTPAKVTISDDKCVRETTVVFQHKERRTVFLAMREFMQPVTTVNTLSDSNDPLQALLNEPKTTFNIDVEEFDFYKPYARQCRDLVVLFNDDLFKEHMASQIINYFRRFAPPQCNYYVCPYSDLKSESIVANFARARPIDERSVAAVELSHEVNSRATNCFTPLLHRAVDLLFPEHAHEQFGFHLQNMPMFGCVVDRYLKHQHFARRTSYRVVFRTRDAYGNATTFKLKRTFRTQQDAEAAVRQLQAAPLRVESLTKETAPLPPPPGLSQSLLVQLALDRLHMMPDATMNAAVQLATNLLISTPFTAGTGYSRDFDYRQAIQGVRRAMMLDGEVACLNELSRTFVPIAKDPRTVGSAIYPTAGGANWRKIILTSFRRRGAMTPNEARQFDLLDTMAKRRDFAGLCKVLPCCRLYKLIAEYFLYSISPPPTETRVTATLASPAGALVATNAVRSESPFWPVPQKPSANPRLCSLSFQGGAAVAGTFEVVAKTTAPPGLMTLSELFDSIAVFDGGISQKTFTAIPDMKKFVTTDMKTLTLTPTPLCLHLVHVLNTFAPQLVMPEMSVRFKELLIDVRVGDAGVAEVRQQITQELFDAYLSMSRLLNEYELQQRAD